MIIECAKCKAKFTLDDSLLRKRGTKVQCSICKDIFMVYPEKPTVTRETLPDQASLGGDAAPSPTKKDSGFIDEARQAEFDAAIEEALDEDTIQASLAEDDSEEALEIGQALERELKEDFEIQKERLEEREDAGSISTRADRSRARNGPSSPFLIILLVILILLGGAAAVYFVAPQIIPDSLLRLKPGKDEGQESIDAGISKLSFRGVTGSFVQSDKAGQLFVIKGMVANEYSKSRSYILIKGTILDDKGQVVKRKMVYAGNTFSEKEIKGMTLEQIDVGLKNRPGKGNINLNISPNRAIPFMIILGDLPENLSEFTVEAVSSSPGK